MCDKYERCPREPHPVARKDYCPICTTQAHYSIEELDNIKHNSFELEKFYLNILRDLAEILSVDSVFVFGKVRNWQEGTESQTFLRNVIDILFAINTD